jgi:hypothetical protein
MTARAMIDQARADGLELRSNGDKLKLSGPAAVVERWKPRIVASKSEILAALQPARTSCATCANVTPRGGCVEPVASGLSELDGVIRYHPTGGDGCLLFKGYSK